MSANCTTVKTKAQLQKQMHNCKNKGTTAKTYVGIIQQNGTTVKTKAQLQKQRHNCKNKGTTAKNNFAFYIALSTPPTRLRTLLSHDPLHAPRSTLAPHTATVTIHHATYHETSSRTTARQKHKHGRLPWLSLFAHNFSISWSYVGQKELPPSFEGGSTWGKSTPILKTPPTLET